MSYTCFHFSYMFNIVFDLCALLPPVVFRTMIIILIDIFKTFSFLSVFLVVEIALTGRPWYKQNVCRIHTHTHTYVVSEVKHAKHARATGSHSN